MSITTFFYVPVTAPTVHLYLRAKTPPDPAPSIWPHNVFEILYHHIRNRSLFFAPAVELSLELAMPRPSIDLEQWRQHIIDLYADGAQPEAIANDIQKRSGLPCSKRTIHRRISQWEIPRRLKKSVITDELRERIATLFLLGTSERNTEPEEEEGKDQAPPALSTRAAVKGKAETKKERVTVMHI